MASPINLSGISVSDFIGQAEETPEPVITPVEETPATAAPVETPVAIPTPTVETPLPVEETPTDEPTVIESLKGLLGYEVDGEFDDSYEGIAKFATTVGETIAAQRLAEEDESFPDVAEYREYRRNGGRPQDYFAVNAPEVDYTTLDVSENNVALQRQLVSNHLFAQGYSPEDVAETVKEYEDSALLFKQALRSKTILAKGQEVEKASIIEAQREQALRQVEETKQYWTGIQQVVSKGNLAGINIPEADKNAFFDWMSKPIDKAGNSKRALERAALTPEQELLTEYLLYKKLDLSALAKTIKTTQATVDLKKKLNPTPSAVVRTQGGNSGSSRAATLPSLEEIFNQN